LGKYPISTTAPRTSEATQCTVCPEAYYCRACAVNEDCGSENGLPVHFKKLACPKGHYCPEGVRRSTEFPCPAGTYQPLDGQTSIAACQPCSAGSYCLQGSATEYPCPPGSYCPTTGIRDPQEYLAPAGRRLPATGASTLPTTATTDATRTSLLQQFAWLGYALLVPPGPILALLDTIRKIPLLRSLPSTNVRLVMSTEYAQLWLTVSLVAARVSLVPTTIVKRATSAQSRQRAGSRSLVLQ